MGAVIPSLVLCTRAPVPPTMSVREQRPCDDEVSDEVHFAEVRMVKLIVDGRGEFEVQQGKRLVNALVDEAGVDQLHACGGKAKCTTCKVEFIEGEPSAMTRAEQEVLERKGLQGVRLSCQIECQNDMTVRVVSRLEGSGRADAGPRPGDSIEPTPEWLPR